MHSSALIGFRFCRLVLLAFLICRSLLAAPPEVTTPRFLPGGYASQTLVLSAEVLSQPSDFQLLLPVNHNSGWQRFTLYSITGKKLRQTAVRVEASAQAISAADLFYGPHKPAGGFYFYSLTQVDYRGGDEQPGDPYFADISATNLPGDSLTDAFTQFGDVTGDGFPDIVLGLNNFSSPLQPQIFVNDGQGRFLNQTAARLPALGLLVNDVMVLDVDQDGDNDIYFAADDVTAPLQNKDRLLLNDGQGVFSEAGRGYLPPLPSISTNAGWGYINNDPYPDIVITMLLVPGALPFETPLAVLINDGSGRFSDQSHLLPFSQYNAFDPVISDVNGDSLSDIMLASLGDLIISDPGGNPIDTLLGREAVFIQQPGGSFTDETTTRLPDINRTTRLLKSTDVNGDMRPDFYALNIGFTAGQALNVLYVNDGNGGFRDETSARLPVESIIWNNDAEFSDFDGNGFPDLFMINVFPGAPAADFLYFNSAGIFTDESAHLPAVIDFNVSCTAGDIEHDGDDDIFISVASETSFVGIPDRLYENILPVTGIASPTVGRPDFRLAQNYPNPFNPSTTIFFDLPHASLITLHVYDLLGRKVKTLLDGRKSAGSYSLQWDGTNDSGEPVAGGIYLYRLTAGRFLKTRKMLLLR